MVLIACHQQAAVQTGIFDTLCACHLSLASTHKQRQSVQSVSYF